MRAYFLYIALFSYISSLAQKEEQVFVISPNKNIHLIPSLDTLIAGNTYQFRLAGLKPADIAKATLAEGTVIATDSEISIRINPTTSLGKKCLLQLFTKKDKILRIAYQQKFSVVPSLSVPEFAMRAPVLASELVLSWEWKRLEAKNSMSKTELLRSIGTYGDGIPSIELNASNSTSGGAVGKFTMDITCGGQTQNFSSSHRLSTEMIEAIRQATPGCLIKLSKVHCMLLMTLDERIMGPFEIVVK